VAGVVLDPAGYPVSGLLVFAVAERSGEVVATGRTDQKGEFRLTYRAPLAAPVVRLGVYSSFHWVSGSHFDSGQALLVVSARPHGVTPEMAAAVEAHGTLVPDAPGPPASAKNGNDISEKSPTTAEASEEFRLLSGCVRDETGVALPGVSVVTRSEPRGAVLVQITNAQGCYEVALGGGRARIAAASPALKVKSATTKVGPGSAVRVDFVMEIDAAPQSVAVGSGHTLTFAMNESSWPEYFPPPKVQAWLAFSYGIPRSFYHTCPSMAHTDSNGAPIPTHCPPSVFAREKGLAKYWWLELLKTSPSPHSSPIAPTGLPPSTTNPHVAPPD
jgi:hypothetical protein